VKLADNADNLDPIRPVIAGGEEMAERKYLPARAILRAALGGDIGPAISQITGASVLPRFTTQGWG